MQGDMVVARNMNVQALFGRFGAASDHFIDSLRSLPHFQDHRLTREELTTTDLPGFYTENGTSFLRWKESGLAVNVLHAGDVHDVRVDIIDQLDGWQPDDPRYEERLQTMERILSQIADTAGLTQLHLRIDDPGVELRVRGLKRAYGAVSPSLQGSEEEYLAVTALQGVGADPFIRCHQR